MDFGRAEVFDCNAIHHRRQRLGSAALFVVVACSLVEDQSFFSAQQSLDGWMGFGRRGSYVQVAISGGVRWADDAAI